MTGAADGWRRGPGEANFSARRSAGTNPARVRVVAAHQDPRSPKVSSPLPSASADLRPARLDAPATVRAPASGADARPVLVVAPQPFYEDRGTPIAVLQVVEALSQLGYQVDLLTFPAGRPTPVAVPGLRIFRAANPFGIRRVPVGFSLRKLALDATLVWALWRRLRRPSYCCIHAVEEAAFPAVAFGRGRGIPVIYDMQSSLPEQLAVKAPFGSAPFQRALRACERWLLRRATVVVSSTGLAHKVRGLAPTARGREWRFASHGRAVDPARVDELRYSLGIRRQSPVVVYTGTFEGYQGIPEILSAIEQVRRRVPEVSFVLVGATASDHGSLPPAVAELERVGALRLVPRQPRTTIPEYLALADVLVSARAFGGNVPLKIFDYLAAGRAIVATDIPTHRTLLDESRAVLVPAADGALGTAIADLLEDPKRRTRLAAAGRQYADEHLGWAQFVEAVDDLYAEVRAVSAD